MIFTAWSPYICNNHENASDIDPKRILRLSIHRLQIFLVKYDYLRSLQLREDQGIREKCVCNHVLAILTTYMETRLKRKNLIHGRETATIYNCIAQNVQTYFRSSYMYHISSYICTLWLLAKAELLFCKLSNILFQPD